MQIIDTTCSFLGTAVSRCISALTLVLNFQFDGFSIMLIGFPIATFGRQISVSCP